MRYIQTSQPNSDNLIQYIVFNYFPIDLVIGNSITTYSSQMGKCSKKFEILKIQKIKKDF